MKLIIVVLFIFLLAGCDSEPLCQPEKGIHNYWPFWKPCNNKMFDNGENAFMYEYRECWPCGKRQIRKIEIVPANAANQASNEVR